MTDISRALSIQGWMGDMELQYLAEQAEKALMIAEIGSWMGRSTAALADNTRGIVMAFDTWRGSPEHEGHLAGKDGDWLYREFLKNARLSRVFPVRIASQDAAKDFPFVTKFDLIFIDANHDYGSVKADILAWTQLLAPGGVICGHDYDPPNWMGVYNAVNECVPRFRVVPSTTIWTTEGAMDVDGTSWSLTQNCFFRHME